MRRKCAVYKPSEGYSGGLYFVPVKGKNEETFLKYTYIGVGKKLGVMFVDDKVLKFRKCSAFKENDEGYSTKESIEWEVADYSYHE